MKYIIIILLLLVAAACRERVTEKQQNGLQAPVFPDYADCIVPVNIAPLNFEVMKGCDEVEVVYQVGEKVLLTYRGDQYVELPLRKWKKLMGEAAKSGKVKVLISCRSGEQWEQFNPVYFQVSSDPIDEWIAYRLIFPGYEGWARMGLFQRNVTDFQEKTILDNNMTGKNCMNCHSFNRYSPDQFVFHMRGATKGTILVEGENCSLVNGKMGEQAVPLVYPAWHPSGHYIAFSSNSTRQFFHAHPEKQIEVYDESSDIVLYDVERKQVVTDSALLARPEAFETYPAWSPSGDRLYFSCTDSVSMPDDYKKIQYKICSVGFDAGKGTFYGPVDTVLTIPGKSIVFPRISPNGRFLLVSTLDYGCFPAWHKESDLVMWDLTSKQFIPHLANSFDADGYHSWSSNGKWVMFGSRRIDGLFTRLWFAYVQEDGKLCKPFLLPQSGELLKDTRKKSYNVPEFISRPITVSPRKLLRAAEN